MRLNLILPHNTLDTLPCAVPVPESQPSSSSSSCLAPRHGSQSPPLITIRVKNAPRVRGAVDAVSPDEGGFYGPTPRRHHQGGDGRSPPARDGGYVRSQAVPTASARSEERRVGK